MSSNGLYQSILDEKSSALRPNIAFIGSYATFVGQLSCNFYFAEAYKVQKLQRLKLSCFLHPIKDTTEQNGGKNFTRSNNTSA